MTTTSSRLAFSSPRSSAFSRPRSAFSPPRPFPLPRPWSASAARGATTRPSTSISVTAARRFLVVIINLLGAPAGGHQQQHDAADHREAADNWRDRQRLSLGRLRFDGYNVDDLSDGHEPDRCKCCAAISLVSGHLCCSLLRTISSRHVDNRSWCVD